MEVIFLIIFSKKIKVGAPKCAENTFFGGFKEKNKNIFNHSLARS